MTEKKSEELHGDDGISEELFSMLWTRDESNSGPEINIPDTITFKYGQPINWYFTASNGRLKRKVKESVLSSKIEEAFTSCVLGYDVIATFYPVSKEIQQNSDTLLANTVQFLDRKAFLDLLYHSKTTDHGIMQRFIEPKGVRNEIIKSIWSPKVCLLERCENIYNLHDHRYGLYEKCLTIEGPDYYSVSATIRGPLAAYLQNYCEKVVSHIGEINFGHKSVSRMVLNFKMDSQEKIWLLFATSIRYELPRIKTDFSSTAPETKLINIGTVLSLPPLVSLNPLKAYDKTNLNQHQGYCVSCAQDTLHTRKHPISYKAVFKHYEYVLQLQRAATIKEGKKQMPWPPMPDIIASAGGVGFGCLDLVSKFDPLARFVSIPMNEDEYHGSDLSIPPMIRFLHTGLKPAEFQRHKQDPLYLYKTLNVCESCYLTYADFMTIILRLGGDIKKLVTPDPESMAATAVQFSSWSASELSSMEGPLHKPSEEEWRALSVASQVQASATVVAAKPGQVPNAKLHKIAMEVSIGLKSKEGIHQPLVPATIRTRKDAVSKFSNSFVDERDAAVSVQVGRDGDNDHATVSASFSAALTKCQSRRDNDSSRISNKSLVTASDRSSAADMVSANNQWVQPENILQLVSASEFQFYKDLKKNSHLRNHDGVMSIVAEGEERKLYLAHEYNTLPSKSRVKVSGGSRWGDGIGVYEVEMPYVNNGIVVAPLQAIEQTKHQLALKSEVNKPRTLRRRLFDRFRDAIPGTVSAALPTGVRGSSRSTVAAAEDSIDGRVSVGAIEEALKALGNSSSADTASYHQFLLGALKEATKNGQVDEMKPTEAPHNSGFVGGLVSESAPIASVRSSNSSSMGSNLNTAGTSGTAGSTASSKTAGITVGAVGAVATTAASVTAADGGVMKDSTDSQKRGAHVTSLRPKFLDNVGGGRESDCPDHVDPAVVSSTACSDHTGPSRSMFQSSSSDGAHNEVSAAIVTSTETSSSIYVKDAEAGDGTDTEGKSSALLSTGQKSVFSLHPQATQWEQGITRTEEEAIAIAAVPCAALPPVAAAAGGGGGSKESAKFQAKSVSALISSVTKPLLQQRDNIISDENSITKRDENSITKSDANNKCSANSEFATNKDTMQYPTVTSRHELISSPLKATAWVPLALDDLDQLTPRETNMQLDINLGLDSDYDLLYKTDVGIAGGRIGPAASYAAHIPPTASSIVPSPRTVAEKKFDFTREVGELGILTELNDLRMYVLLSIRLISF